MSRLRPTVCALSVAATAAAGVLAVAVPAYAAVPQLCKDKGYTNGRNVVTDNDNNGGGAYVTATLCWKPYGSGTYNTFTRYSVRDTAADGAGATIRFEWTGLDSGNTYYYVPDSQYRAWTYGDTVSSDVELGNIQGLYVRACLTNTGSPAHHCGPKV
jgi:hypothetical protein